MTKSGPRSTNMIRSVLALLREHRWLFELDEQLMSLVEECIDDSEVELVLNLLRRFTYLTAGEFVQAQNECVEHFISAWGLADSSTQIMATTMGDGSDSAQYLLYGIKRKLEVRGWSNVRLVNNASRPTRYLSTHPDIILFDEFIGTGNTVMNRIDNLKRVARDQGSSLSGTRIFVCAIAATKQGCTHIEQEGYQFFASYLLDKGITDFYNCQELEMRIHQMLRMESTLTTKYGKHEMPSFGYGQCEALYARDDGNSPNNVFPIFWWPYRSDSHVRRKTLLIRYMGDE